jgi:hypothetical protein
MSSTAGLLLPSFDERAAMLGVLIRATIRKHWAAWTEGELELLDHELAHHAPDFDSRAIEERIEALRARCAEDGTHSTLDVDRVSDTPSYGAASPLGEGELQVLFGTTRPTHAHVREKQSELIEHRRRGMASYVVIYTDGEPTEIAFAGISGD